MRKTIRKKQSSAGQPKVQQKWKTIRIEITPPAYDIQTPERCLDTSLEYRDAKAIVDAHNASSGVEQGREWWLNDHYVGYGTNFAAIEVGGSQNPIHVREVLRDKQKEQE